MSSSRSGRDRRGRRPAGPALPLGVCGARGDVGTEQAETTRHRWVRVEQAPSSASVPPGELSARTRPCPQLAAPSASFPERPPRARRCPRQQRLQRTAGAAAERGGVSPSLGTSAAWRKQQREPHVSARDATGRATHGEGSGRGVFTVHVIRPATSKTHTLLFTSSFHVSRIRLVSGTRRSSWLLSRVAPGLGETLEEPGATCAWIPAEVPCHEPLAPPGPLGPEERRGGGSSAHTQSWRPQTSNPSFFFFLTTFCFVSFCFVFVQGTDPPNRRNARVFRCPLCPSPSQGSFLRCGPRRSFLHFPSCVLRPGRRQQGWPPGSGRLPGPLVSGHLPVCRPKGFSCSTATRQTVTQPAFPPEGDPASSGLR